MENSVLSGRLESRVGFNAGAMGGQVFGIIEHWRGLSDNGARPRRTNTLELNMIQKIPNFPESPTIETLKLSNGMQVMLCPMGQMHRCQVLLNVASGCRDERRPGTAHMLEHLIFRGSKAYPGLRALSEAFEAYGADFNAFTAREVTSFEVSSPAESLEAVLMMLGEVMREPKLHGIAAEREIIREEILPDYDADNTLINVDDLMVSLFYGEAGRPIAGDPDDLAQITREEVVGFYEAHYAAPNMVLVMAGAVGDAASMKPILEAAFGGISRAFRPWPRREMPTEYREAISKNNSVKSRLCVKKYDGAVQSEVLLGFLECEASRPEFSAIEMLIRVLDDGMASRLSRRLVEELALVYDAEAFLSTTQESTLAQIRVSCRHRRVSKVVSAVYAILSEIARDGVEREELERIRRRVVWEHIGMLDNTGQWVSWLSTMKLQHLPYDLRARCEALCAVTGEEIRSVARGMLRERAHIVAVVGDPSAHICEEIQAVMEKNLEREVVFSKL